MTDCTLLGWRDGLFRPPWLLQPFIEEPSVDGNGRRSQSVEKASHVLRHVGLAREVEIEWDDEKNATCLGPNVELALGFGHGYLL